MPMTTEIEVRPRIAPAVAPGYPVLSPQALGWLNFLHRKVNLRDDWTRDGQPSPAWDNVSLAPVMNMHRYDLTYSTMPVAMMVEVTPAWRELYGQILDSLCQRMTQYWAWWDWVEQIGQDPDRAAYPAWYYQAFIPPGLQGVYSKPGWCSNGLPPYKFDPDPVWGLGFGYVMWKGYFNLMLGHYEYVTGDAKFDAPIEIVYDEAIRYRYSHSQITEITAAQWVNKAVMGICCEVTKAYPWCNNLTGLSVKLHDVIHGTSHYWQYLHWKAMLKQHLMGFTPTGEVEWLTTYYDPDLRITMNLPQHQRARNWLSNAWFLLPQDPDLATRLYEQAKQRFGVVTPEGAAYMGLQHGDLKEESYSTALALALAKELGDDDFYPRLRRHVDAVHQPVTDAARRNEFYYLFGFNEPFPRGLYNAVVLPAFIGGPRTWWRLYNRPNLEKFYQPTLAGIDYPTVGVRQAIYDPARRALVGAIFANDSYASGQPTSFRVENLDGGRYSLGLDGQEHTDWERQGRALLVRTTVDTHSFVVQRLE